MSDIVLVYPSTGMDISPTIAPPHSVLAIGSLPSRSGYKVKIIDQRIDNDWRNTLRHELLTQPILVGISTMTGSQIHFGIEAAKIARHSKIPIVWGGVHPSLMPEQTLQSEWVDMVFAGEAEYGLKELADAISNHQSLGNVDGIYYKCGNDIMQSRPRVKIDLNQKPQTDWSLIDIEKYIHPDLYMNNVMRTLDIGQTSRGCPFSCAFCCVGGHGWRGMDAELAIYMITDLVKEYKLDGIWLRDDEFYINQERAAKICKGIMPLGIKWYSSGTRIDIFNKTRDENIEIYKRSGAKIMKFGAESGSNRILKLLKKGFTTDAIIEANLKAKRVGIIPAYNLMGGIPTQTLEEYNETIDMIFKLKENNPAARFETIMTYAPMPGTPLWDMSVEYGLKPPEKLEDWINWRFDEYDESGARNPWYTKRERQTIGNIVYLASLTFVVPALLSGYKKNIWHRLVNLIYYLPQKYFEYRLRHKWYKNMPEVRMIRWLRGKVFYK